MYPVAVFLVYYGFRSFRSGVKKENKKYWVAVGYTQGLKKLLKEKYEDYTNIFFGIISLVSGLLIIIIYRP